jgi:hypothetical protein
MDIFSISSFAIIEETTSEQVCWFTMLHMTWNYCCGNSVSIIFPKSNIKRFHICNWIFFATSSFVISNFVITYFAIIEKKYFRTSLLVHNVSHDVELMQWKFCGIWNSPKLKQGQMLLLSIKTQDFLINVKSY